MKSRTSELLDRSIAAMSAAIEIYNKPHFPHRLETFTILAINGWELLLKSRWLTLHQNKPNSLFVYENKKTKDGSKSKKRTIRKTRSGTAYSHSIDYLTTQLVAGGHLDVAVKQNIDALVELRDTAVHYYSPTPHFQVRTHELAAACVKNFAVAANAWFRRDLSELDIGLLPLAFLEAPSTVHAIPSRASETKFLEFLGGLSESDLNADSPYSLTVQVELRLTRSNAQDALTAQITNDPSATKVYLTEEQIRERYPWDYSDLNDRCSKRYSDFKRNQQYHTIRKKLEEDEKFAAVRYLDPGNPKSSKKTFYNPNILQELDKHYQLA